MEINMPFPEIYTKIIFAAVTFFCAALSVGSVAFYNTLHKKELLSDTCSTKKARSPFIFILTALFGLGIGIAFAYIDITIENFFVILLIPAAITICICDCLNGFVPIIGTIITSICTVLRVIALCAINEEIWYIFTFIFGGLCGLAAMLTINFIAKKTGSIIADKGHIAVISVLWASSGIFSGAAILAAAEISALIFYVLPRFFIAKKNGEAEPFSQIKYPLTPFLFLCYYAAVIIGMF